MRAVCQRVTEASVLVEGATVGGKAYGLPWYAGARALIYRKDVLAGLGLNPPTTWDELLSVGRAVRDRAHLFAFGVAGNAAHYFLPMVWQNGGEIASQKDGTWVSGGPAEFGTGVFGLPDPSDPQNRPHDGFQTLLTAVRESQDWKKVRLMAEADGSQATCLDYAVPAYEGLNGLTFPYRPKP